MNNIKTPTDEQILRYADDLGVLKGYAVDNYTRWVYIHDVTGYDDYVTVDATSEVLALARYAASLAAPEVVEVVSPELATIAQDAQDQAKTPPNLVSITNASRVLEAVRPFLPERIVPEADGGIRLYWFSLGTVSICCDNDGDIFVTSGNSKSATAARVWHSMETAPKDGSYILGHNKTVDGEDDYAVVFWFESVDHSGSWTTGTYDWEPEEWTPCDGISPVSVTEGLPEKKDCDPNGYFWVFVEDDKRWEWMHIGDMNWQYRDHHGYTHWAPWWAFPLPEVK